MIRILQKYFEICTYALTWVDKYVVDIIVITVPRKKMLYLDCSVVEKRVASERG